MKRILSLLLSAALCAGLAACGQKTASGNTEPKDTTARNWEDAVSIELSDETVTVDGEVASSDAASAVYTAKDIVYYEEGKDFTYGEGAEADAHSAEEAGAHTVVHITQPGTYVLQGKLSAGQVAVDLGEDAEEDSNAVVTLILNGVDITCTVAPAVIFYNVYECGSTDTETASESVDTSAAGANVIIADGTENFVTGSYVARIYKPDTVVLSEDGTEVEEAKKLHKYDAAFYSRMSMNISGESSGVDVGSGVLNIDAENEGLDSELHLTINGGNLNIVSGNDGINTNEDGVSVTTINGGSVTIQVDGSTGEGDGIDSNGWLVINGGTVIAEACSDSADAGIDSELGIHINGGTVVATGHMLDRIEDGGQNYAVFSFAQTQGGQAITLKNAGGETVGTWMPENRFTNMAISMPELTAGDYTLWQGDTQLAAGAGGFGGGKGGPGMMGGGFRPADGTERPEGGAMREPPKMNEDGTVTLPDGTAVDPNELQQRPEGGSRGPGGGDRSGKGENSAMGEAEASSTFTIQDGGNQFSGVAAAE